MVIWGSGGGGGSSWGGSSGGGGGTVGAVSVAAEISAAVVRAEASLIQF